MSEKKSGIGRTLRLIAAGFIVYVFVLPLIPGMKKAATELRSVDPLLLLLGVVLEFLALFCYSLLTKAALGDLSRIRAVVKLLGMVNAEPDFADHPKVINGCSDLLVNVLGEAGRHARSAVGMGSLPNRMTVEVEAILQVSP